MTRNDIPYVLLVAVFGVALFFAGRYSVPTAQVVAPAPAVQVSPMTPQVIVIASTSAEPAAPPVAIMVEKSAPEVSAKPLVKKPMGATPAKPVPSVHVELEDEPVNPYRTNDSPGF